MKVKTIVLGLLVSVFSFPAFAFHCPKDMKKIDAALSSPKPMSADQMAEIKKLRADGEAFHKSGQHQKSVDSLAQAMKILGIE